MCARVSVCSFLSATCLLSLPATMTRDGLTNGTSARLLLQVRLLLAHCYETSLLIRFTILTSDLGRLCSRSVSQGFPCAGEPDRKPARPVPPRSFTETSPYRAVLCLLWPRAIDLGGRVPFGHVLLPLFACLCCSMRRTRLGRGRYGWPRTCDAAAPFAATVSSRRHTSWKYQ